MYARLHGDDIDEHQNGRHKEHKQHKRADRLYHDVSVLIFFHGVSTP